jgi:hypothetical protein
MWFVSLADESFIKKNGMVKVNPKIVLDFTQDLIETNMNKLLHKMSVKS